jgi:hypothetical protein
MWTQRREELEAARAQLAAAEAADEAMSEDERLHSRAESLSQLGKDDESFDLYAALAEASCEIAYAALREKGLDRDAHAWGERYQQQAELIEAARVESWQINLNDDLVPTTIDEKTQQAILDRCRAAKWVGKVWIARKNLTKLPISVDCVFVRAKAWRFGSQKKLQKLADSMDFESQLMVFRIDSGALMRKLDRLGARRA